MMLIRYGTQKMLLQQEGLPDLRDWWSQLGSHGPKFGYFPNATKTWLITKEKHLTTATASFANTGVQVTAEGRPYLATAL